MALFCSLWDSPYLSMQTYTVRWDKATDVLERELLINITSYLSLLPCTCEALFYNLFYFCIISSWSLSTRKESILPPSSGQYRTCRFSLKMQEHLWETLSKIYLAKKQMHGHEEKTDQDLSWLIHVSKRASCSSWWVMKYWIWCTVLNLWVPSPVGNWMTLSQGLHIIYPVYQTFSLWVITAVNLHTANEVVKK